MTSNESRFIDDFDFRELLAETLKEVLVSNFSVDPDESDSWALFCIPNWNELKNRSSTNIDTATERFDCAATLEDKCRILNSFAYEMAELFLSDKKKVKNYSASSEDLGNLSSWLAARDKSDDGTSDEYSRWAQSSVGLLRQFLSKREYEIVVLKHIRGLKQYEIAQKLGISAATVSRDVKRVGEIAKEKIAPFRIVAA